MSTWKNCHSAAGQGFCSPSHTNERDCPVCKFGTLEVRGDHVWCIDCGFQMDNKPMKVHPIKQPSQFQFMFFCPGCQCGHGIRVGQPDGPNWDFNGDMQKPTVRPSILVVGGEHNIRCHSFVTDGKIQFLSDCSHKLAGQTVPLEDF